jgi:transcriptional regulator with XRE-family HTH domain
MAKSKPVYGRGTGKPHPIDVHVGARVRQRRALLGMNQTILGKALGVSFQQVQKYENGTNRISASKLFKLSQVLDMSIEHFFEDMPPEVAARPPAKRRDPDLMARQETLEFVRGYYKIRDPLCRKRVYELTKALGAADV